MKDGDDAESWPLLPAERAWSAVTLLVVLVVAAAANWCYMIGGYVGAYLDLRSGFAAMTAGTLIGVGLVVLATVPTTVRFGIDSITAARPQLGTAGWLLSVPLQYVSVVGWNAILVIFCGRSIAEFLATLGITQQPAHASIVPATSLVSAVVVFIVLRGGIAGVQRIANVLFLCIVGVALSMVALILSQHAAGLAEAKPRLAVPDMRWNYVTGIEIGIVSVLSWWPYIGAMVRQAPGARSAVVPVILGLALPVPVLSTIGLAAVLAIGVSDPARWMTVLGGPVYGAVALALLALTNLGTALVGIYASALGLRSVPVLAAARWELLLLVAILPVAVVGAFLHEPFYAGFGSFLAVLGILFAPLCGIQIVDYFVLRRRRIEVRGLYRSGPGSPYHFWSGLNPAAIAGMAAGFSTYVYLLDPVSYASHWPYEHMTASLPTALAGAAAYWAVTVALVRPAGRGGYLGPSSTATRPRP